MQVAELAKQNLSSAGALALSVSLLTRYVVTAMDLESGGPAFEGAVDGRNLWTVKCVRQTKERRPGQPPPRPKPRAECPTLHDHDQDPWKYGRAIRGHRGTGGKKAERKEKRFAFSRTSQCHDTVHAEIFEQRTETPSLKQKHANDHDYDFVLANRNME